jgi:pterin-4a-carbinolamine dehydratase
MDFNALQHKLFALDPSDLAADKQALIAQAQGAVVDTPKVDYVTESTEVPKGSMPIDLDLAGLTALAGVRLDEKQKMGSAGQAKGKDPMPKAEPGRTKHPLKDKLVGEAETSTGFEPQGFKAAFKNYNKVDPWLGTSTDDDGKKKDEPKTPPKKGEKPAPGPTPGPTPKPTPSPWPTSKEGYTLKVGDLVTYANKKGQTREDVPVVKLLKGTKDGKGRPQIQLQLRGATYAISREQIQKVNGKTFTLDDAEAGTGTLKDQLLQALEAYKQKPQIKPRDPNAQAMNDLRRSGAMGAHKDKKRDAKMGKVKHKGKIDESKMSFNDMMKNREFYYTYKQYVSGNANVDQVAELVRGRVDKEKFADEIHRKGVEYGGAKGKRIKDLADIIRKDSNVLDLPGKAFSKIKKMVGMGEGMDESYTKVDGMEAEELRKQYAKDWEIRKGKYLYKKVAFDDYNTVLRFLMVIEKPQIELDHFANIKFFYNEAELVVYTHDTKGLTTLDFKLAVQIDRALDRMGAKEIG